MRLRKRQTARDLPVSFGNLGANHRSRSEAATHVQSLRFRDILAGFRCDLNYRGRLREI
jgi:hypothetical protein